MSVPPASSQRRLTSTMMSSYSGQQQVKVVAGYALQQKLGSGSFAVVYKGVRIPQQQAQQLPTATTATATTATTTADVVAIKAITRNSEKLTKKVFQNLEIEIAILRTYRHANIVCMHEVQKTASHYYLFLEYCGGGDVQRLIRTRRTGRLSETLTRRLMRDLSSGLEFLWGQQLIHRDIKPQNLLLTGPLPLDEMHDPESNAEMEDRRQKAHFPSHQFVLKIADFGFARHLQSASLAETLCGSPLYMAPEILQHQRYDAKADLWSVGAVLFEMISGRPPFTGENHIDLLRNIQRKAVRLPPDVQVSKECVNLLRLLLNRNPVNRAGFQEFFNACDAFVALGCGGGTTTAATSIDSGRATSALGTIPEHGTEQPTLAESLHTVATNAPRSSYQLLSTPKLSSPAPTPSYATSTSSTNAPVPISPTPQEQQQRENLVSAQPQHHMITPLVPSPPTTGGAHVYSYQHRQQQALLQDHNALPSAEELRPASNLSRMQEQEQQQDEQQHQQYFAFKDQDDAAMQRNDSQANLNSVENSFVMVEHSFVQPQPAATAAAPQSSAMVPVSDHYHRLQQQQQQHHHPHEAMHRLESSPPSSPGIYFGSPMLGGRGEYIKQPPKGMLSTSPGTGGALMGMLIGRAPRLIQDNNSSLGNNNSSKLLDSQIASAAKMIAIAEDVGRRAITVAHLGDSRAYLAMKMLVMMMNQGGSSSLLSMTPMEGIEEEQERVAGNTGRGGDPQDSGAVTDDSSSTEIMSAVRSRRRRSSSTEKSMAHKIEETEEMPFAVVASTGTTPESPPLLPAGIPTRASASFFYHHGSRGGSVGTSITTARSATVKPTPTMIHTYFSEALSCYLRALKMLKTAVDAAQRVHKEVDVFIMNNNNNNNNNPTMRMNNEQLHQVHKLRKRCEVTPRWLGEQFIGVLERGDAANVEIAKLATCLSSSQGLIPGTGVERGEGTTVSTTTPTMKCVEELIYNQALAFGRDGAVKQLLGQFEAARSCYRSAGLLAETLLMEPRMDMDDRKILEGYVDGFAVRITELDRVMLQQSRMMVTSSGFVSSTGGSSSRRGSAVVGLVGGVGGQTYLGGIMDGIPTMTSTPPPS